MDLREFLKNKNIKVTKGRIEILEILRISNNSLSAEKIYQVCKCDNININLSTIYRTLELFEEKDIIDKIVLQDGVFSYKLKKKTHIHFLKCDICKKEVEIPCPMIQIQEIVESNTGFTLTDHNIMLKGICKECKKTNNENHS